MHPAITAEGDKINVVSKEFEGDTTICIDDYGRRWAMEFDGLRLQGGPQVPAEPEAAAAVEPEPEVTEVDEDAIPVSFTTEPTPEELAPVQEGPDAGTPTKDDLLDGLDPLPVDAIAGDFDGQIGPLGNGSIPGDYPGITEPVDWANENAPEAPSDEAVIPAEPESPVADA